VPYSRSSGTTSVSALLSPVNRKRKAELELPRRFGAQPTAAALQATAANVNFAKVDHLFKRSHAAEEVIPGAASWRQR